MQPKIKPSNPTDHLGIVAQINPPPLKKKVFRVGFYYCYSETRDVGVSVGFFSRAVANPLPLPLWYGDEDILFIVYAFEERSWPISSSQSLLTMICLTKYQRFFLSVFSFKWQFLIFHQEKSYWSFLISIFISKFTQFAVLLC